MDKQYLNDLETQEENTKKKKATAKRIKRRLKHISAFQGCTDYDDVWHNDTRIDLEEVSVKN